jgi:hypothetical protein
MTKPTLIRVGFLLYSRFVNGVLFAVPFFDSVGNAFGDICPLRMLGGYLQGFDVNLPNDQVFTFLADMRV